MAQVLLLTDLTAVTLNASTGYGVIEDAAIVIEDQTIAWVGAKEDQPSKYAISETSLGGRLVTPGLIDCHTHLVHGGHRAHEFEQRLEGVSYTEIARAGGGILSTVNATRAAREEELLASALRRVDALIAEGVTALEVKSGYGLDQETELKMLRVARQIEAQRPIRVRTSFLGAHAVPKGISSTDYINEICLPALDAAMDQGLVDAVDGFCENIAFSPKEIAYVFEKAQSHGLPIKLHAEQLSPSGGAVLAAEFGALSADHLEFATNEDAQAMARAGTVAVLLPGAFYTLRETQVPPIDPFREAGVPMAVATDLNPGSSPLCSLLLAMNMACTCFQLTPSEALRGTTRIAAKALGLDDCGIIAAGMRADLAIWDAEDPAELSYHIGANLLYQRYFAGEPC